MDGVMMNNCCCQKMVLKNIHNIVAFCVYNFRGKYEDMSTNSTTRYTQNRLFLCITVWMELWRMVVSALRHNLMNYLVVQTSEMEEECDRDQLICNDRNLWKTGTTFSSKPIRRSCTVMNFEKQSFTFMGTVAAWCIASTHSSCCHSSIFLPLYAELPWQWTPWHCANNATGAATLSE